MDRRMPDKKQPSGPYGGSQQPFELPLTQEYCHLLRQRAFLFRVRIKDAYNQSRPEDDAASKEFNLLPFDQCHEVISHFDPERLRNSQLDILAKEDAREAILREHARAEGDVEVFGRAAINELQRHRPLPFPGMTLFPDPERVSEPWAKVLLAYTLLFELDPQTMSDKVARRPILRAWRTSPKLEDALTTTQELGLPALDPKVFLPYGDLAPL